MFAGTDAGADHVQEEHCGAVHDQDEGLDVDVDDNHVRAGRINLKMALNLLGALIIIYFNFHQIKITVP